MKFNWSSKRERAFLSGYAFALRRMIILSICRENERFWKEKRHHVSKNVKSNGCTKFSGHLLLVCVDLNCLKYQWLTIEEHEKL